MLLTVSQISASFRAAVYLSWTGEGAEYDRRQGRG